jgi:WD40 repeat protein
MAIPCALETFESLVVSIWIPPSQRAYKQSVPGSQELEWKLAPIDVPTRYVFVWDLSKGSTNLYGIPNTTSCISPNCRFVAYSTTSRNGRNQVTILDASTGQEMWSMDGIRRWGGEDDEADAFGKVTSLAFSSDGKMLVISDANGSTFIFDVLERVVGL